MPGPISMPIAVGRPSGNGAQPCNSAQSPSGRWPGSPMSVKMGSFGHRFYMASSPGPLMGPLDTYDYKMPSCPISSSIESDHGRLIKALGGDETMGRDEFCQNYTCCGLELRDLHALLEHFEESHVVVVDEQSNRFSHGNLAFDPDSMELDSPPSSTGSSPPDTPTHTTTSAFDTSILRNGNHTPLPYPNAGRQPNNRPTTSYADFQTLMPNPSSTGHPQKSNSSCIPPALLFSNSAPSTASNTPVPSRVPSPSLYHNGAPQASTTLSRPGSSLLLSKPFRCPTKGCNKSYKQANGLKYHITHGQCNFLPRDPSLDGLNDVEADHKSRPYSCQVGSCTRRYKNMNGLRYHYQHSGAHGAAGLALLASGQHSLQLQNQIPKDAFIDQEITFHMDD